VPASSVRFSATIYLVCFCFFKQLAMIFMSILAGNMYESIGFQGAYLVQTVPKNRTSNWLVIYLKQPTSRNGTSNICSVFRITTSSAEVANDEPIPVNRVRGYLAT
jgi:hypothetical protein